MCPNTSDFEVEPPRFMEPNPLDFYFLVHLRPLVYLGRFGNEKTLHQSIFLYCRSIRNCPGIFASVRQCGGHFEHLLGFVT